jgi:glycosyltransferase involved in cell wall biosynthesis
MKSRGLPLATIIVNNYNYERFLSVAIDSALGQTYPKTEVIVVDDGSTDGSRVVLGRYGDRITAILKPNGGQDSAHNAGLAASHGDLVCFLDADDALLPTALECAVPLFAEPDVRGRCTGELVPSASLPEGDLRDAVLQNGPNAYPTPPTSGNLWARRFLAEVFPIPPGPLHPGTGDAYLSMLAPLFGRVRRLTEPQGIYRRHMSNLYWGRLLERLPEALAAHEHHCHILAQVLRSRGVTVDPERWRLASWLHRLRRALDAIVALVPPDAAFVLADEDTWGLPRIVAGRRRLPFLEREGRYWGPPPDDATAVAELDRLREAGAVMFVVGWPAFWWLDYYPGFHRYLQSTFACGLATDEVVAFDLRRRR